MRKAYETTYDKEYADSLSDDVLFEEILALTAQEGAGTESFWQRLNEKSPSLVQKLLKLLQDFINKLKNADPKTAPIPLKEFWKDLEKAHNIIAEAIATSRKPAQQQQQKSGEGQPKFAQKKNKVGDVNLKEYAEKELADVETSLPEDASKDAAYQDKVFKWQDKKLKEAMKINWKDAFPKIFAEGGFDVVLGNLSLKALLESENSRVNGILKLNIIVVALLQEGLGVDHVLTNGRRFPSEISSRGIHLIQSRTILITSSNQKRHSKRSHTTKTISYRVPISTNPL
jgi:hypothetical protein